LARERQFVEEGIRKADIKEFLRRNLQRAKFGGVDIRRTALRTRMVIYAERPGLVIGRRGRNIKSLTQVLQDRYGFDNLQIEVEEIPIPELSPEVMASRLAAMLKAGRPFRRSAYMNLNRIMEAGAQGCEITVSGKIRGQRSRTVRFVDGAITKCGEPSKQVLQGLAVADLKQGMMGIRVKIMPPDTHMPDELDFDNLIEKAKAESAEEAEVESAEEAEVESAEEAEVESAEEAEVESAEEAEKLKIEVRDVPVDEDTAPEGSDEESAEEAGEEESPDTEKEGEE